MQPELNNTDTPASTPETAPEVPQAPEPEKVQNDAPPTDKEPQEGAKEEAPDRGDELPEWAQKERSQLRSEAARYRTERNDLRASVEDMQKKLAEAKTQDDIDAAVSEWKGKVEQLEAAAQREKDVLSALEAAHLSPEYAEFLHGNTAEELKASAERLAGKVVAAGAGLSGGMSPGSAPSADDVQEQIAQIKRRRII